MQAFHSKSIQMVIRVCLMFTSAKVVHFFLHCQNVFHVCMPGTRNKYGLMYNILVSMYLGYKLIFTLCLCCAILISHKHDATDEPFGIISTRG